MRLIYEIDKTLYNLKKTQTRTKRDKLKNTITLFLRNLIRKSKQRLTLYRYQLFSSFV